MQAEDFEALNLQSFGFVHCFYFELQCLCCRQRLRIALDKETIVQHPCPVCGEVQPIEFLAKGFTRKALPFSEPTPDLDCPRYETVRQRRRLRATLQADQRAFVGTH